METLKNSTVHKSTSLRTSLPCINNHHIDDLSKEKEEELLYGTGDEGDEEDALSDDSIRLKLSDDEEIDLEDTVIPGQNKDQQDKSEQIKTKTKEAESDGSELCSVSEPDTTMMEKQSSNDDQEEEHRTGNVSLVERIIQNHPKKNRPYANGAKRPQVVGRPCYPWPTRNPHWRFMHCPNVRSFHNINRIPYPRYRYPAPQEHYRYDLFNNRGRFNYPHPYFPRRRGSGNGQYNGIMNKFDAGHNLQAPKCNTTHYTPKSVATNESQKDSVSSPTQNVSVRSSSHTNVENVDSKKLNMDKNSLDSINELNDSNVVIATIDNVSVDNFNSNPSRDFVEVTSETKFAEETNKGPNNAEIVNGAEDNAEDNVEEKAEEKVEDLPTAEECTITNVPAENQKENDSSTKEQVLSITGVKTSHESDETKSSVNGDTECTEETSEATKFEVECIAIEEENTVIPDSTENSETVDKQEHELSSEIKKNGQLIDDTSINNDPSVQESDNCTSEETVNNESTHVAENNEIVVINNITTESTSDNVELVKNEELQNDKTESEKPLLTCKSDQPEAVDHTNPIDISSVNKIEECDLNEEVLESNVLFASTKDNADAVEQKLNSMDTDDGVNIIKVCKSLGSEKIPDVNERLEQESSNNSLVTIVSNKMEIEPDILVPDVTSMELQCTESISLLTEGDNSDNTSTESRGVKEVKTDRERRSSLDTSLDTNKNNNVESSDNKDSDSQRVSLPRKRGRPRKMIIETRDTQGDLQVKDGVRQKRQTAKNAEETIRKRFLSNDSDLESSDDSDKLVANQKVSRDSCPLSPSSTKRSLSNSDNNIVNGVVKKLKIDLDEQSDEVVIKENGTQSVKHLSYVRRFFQRDLKEKLPKLKQEELEELLIQKIVETITMRGEIGRLREQARISEKNQEATRTRCQQLAKQIKDFETVLSRYANDRRSSNDKFTAPIKINRSVGLQVNFITENGMQNLRQLRQSTTTPTSNNTPVNNEPPASNVTSPRRGIKIRTPRRSEGSTSSQPRQQPTVVSQTHTQSPQVIPTVTPAGLVVSKAIDTQRTISPISGPVNNKIAFISNQQQQQKSPQHQVQQQQQQSTVVNGKIPTQTVRQDSTLNLGKSGTNDLIDLTDEEEKNKAAISLPNITTLIPDQQVNITPKPQQPCFQRVIQTIPGNMTVAGQPASIRVVQPASQPTPTALVNNMHTPRLTYVMQSGVGATRQLLITSNSTQIRPVTSCNRPTFSTLTYKTGVSTIANGTVRVLTTPANATMQVTQHPAPLPDAPTYAVNTALKLAPPAPSLKISKVANGIVLSWNMTLSDKYADIVSYQLYAYQEVSGVPPSTALWKKVGDVRALPLPMACTLTQFSKGNNYYFAVRAVDIHSRKGQYSIPGNISL